MSSTVLALSWLYFGYQYIPYIYTASTYLSHFYSYTKPKPTVPKEFTDTLEKLNENLLEIKENLQELNKMDTKFSFEIISDKEFDNE